MINFLLRTSFYVFGIILFLILLPTFHSMKNMTAEQDEVNNSLVSRLNKDLSNQTELLFKKGYNLTDSDWKLYAPFYRYAGKRRGREMEDIKMSKK